MDSTRDETGTDVDRFKFIDREKKKERQTDRQTDRQRHRER